MKKKDKKYTYKIRIGKQREFLSINLIVTLKMKRML